MAKKKKSYFFWYYQFIMFSYSLQSVYRVILDSTPSRTSYFIVSKFATSPSISQIQYFFFFWLPLIYAFSLSSTCYTLLFTIALIKSLRSTPWWDLTPVLSFWAYDFSPRSLYQLHLFPFHHVWETCCPTQFTPPYFAGFCLPSSMAPSLTSPCKKHFVSTLFLSLALINFLLWYSPFMGHCN